MKFQAAYAANVLLFSYALHPFRTVQSSSLKLTLLGSYSPDIIATVLEVITTLFTRFL